MTNIKEATEPGAPNWLPDRHNWLQYRAIIRQFPELIHSGDAAASELAVRYIELNYFGSYSGFLREQLARALKHADLSGLQQKRLLSQFTTLISSKQCFQEFREYNKLANHIKSQKNA